MLNQLSACGLIGTVRYQWELKSIESKNTTPGSAQLIPLICDMAKDGMKYCVMEVSSHGLDQNRVSGLRFSAAIFTNLTQDHLDYHKTFEDYYLAKRKLFVSKNPPNYSLVNIDDPYGKRLFLEIRNKAIGYGFGVEALYRAAHEVVTLRGSEFDLLHGSKKYRVKTSLPLRYNIYNILAALSTLSELGFSLDQTIPLVSKFPGVPGRMERTDEGQGALIFVDYAHTPDAFFNVLSSTRPLAKGKVIAVFGCGGNRDKSKRPLMGRIASEWSDVVIVTSDNPRQENPDTIMQEIASGIVQSENKNVEFVADRKKAIEYAVDLAGPHDLVLVLGKGHEKSQIIGDKIIPFDDAITVREYLRKKTPVSHAVHS